MRTLAFLLLAACLHSTAARAETHATCTGFITSVPTTISTQGVWCLDKDVATGIASGAAVTIGAHNVTLDCNGFKIGGLAAGSATQTQGVLGQDKLNFTMRNCNVRGFRRGVSLFGGASGGHLIEDNRFDGNTESGVFVSGPGNLVRDNRILDTGAGTLDGSAYGIYIYGDGDAIGNSVDGVFPAIGATHFGSYGIVSAISSAGVIQGNRIRRIDGGTIGSAYGIATFLGEFSAIRDNHISSGTAGGFEVAAMYCGNEAVVAGNSVYDFGTTFSGCDDDGGNVAKP